MLTNYLRVAFRHHRQHKLYSAINTVGLAIAVTCILLAVLYMRDENSFDAFHRHHSRLFRITTSLTGDDGSVHTVGSTGQVQGPAFKAQLPEITGYTRIMGGDIYGDLIANGKVLKQQLLFVDEGFFNLFSFPLLKGNIQTALQDIGSAVITESTARKYFSSTDVIGQLIRMDADPSARRLGKPLIVTAVVKDPPRNSSIQFDVLLPFRFMQLSFDDHNWESQYLSTFVLLHPGASIDKVTREFNAIHAQHTGKDKRNGVAHTISYGLQRITDIHLHPLYSAEGSREGGIINGSHPVFSHLFLGIAVFILLMAAINFINISLAGALNRTREVGVRKINGSTRAQIIGQFLVESALLCLAAFILALLFTWLALPAFNRLSGKEILFTRALDTTLPVYCGLILLVIVLLTGAYPAYLLSGFRAVQVLSGRHGMPGRGILGKALVVVQFSIAVFLLIVTLFFYRQMEYIRTKDLGYNPHQVVVTHISGDRELRQVQAALKSGLADEPGITAISFGGERGGVSAVTLGEKQVDAVHRVIDPYYLPALGISLKEGRNFSDSYPTDKTNGVIVNEAFVKAAGLTHPIGTQLRTDEYFDNEGKTIIGVIRDFHTGSLRERIRPMVMIMSDWFGGTVWMKIERSRQQQALSAVAAAYRKVLPETAFSYSFLDELNAREYKQELRWKKIIYIATVLSILICCSGLFGLVHIATHQRIREIGIRKVLGAGISSIITLFSTDFLRLVLLAVIITCPVAWTVIHHWLRSFAYRVEINAWVFIAAGAFALLIAFGTVVFQVVRTAWANPVNSLRAA